MRFAVRLPSVAIVSLLLLVLASQGASQPPTVQEQALVIEGRVRWVDFGAQTMLLAPADGSLPIITAFARATTKGSAGPSSSESSASSSGQAVGSRHSSSTW
jgi:hypothetical protein